MIKNIFYRYKNVQLPIKKIIAAQFCLQGVNTAFFLLLNYYMVKEGYADHEAANVLSYRFFAVFFLAFPIGLFIKGRRLLPFFWTASIMVPLFSNLIILSIANHWDQLLFISTMLWGIGYTCIQITILPFILLNAKPENHSEAFSLSFLSFSVSLVIVGLSNYLLNNISPTLFNEKNMLFLISALSFISIYFVATTRIKEKVSNRIPIKKVIYKYEWGTIFKAVIPSFIIAVGAGFTIPVINLFFLSVHEVDSDTFSMLGSFTFLLVATVKIFMP